MTSFWDNTVAVVGVVSGIFSIFGVFGPLHLRGSRWRLGAYIFLVAGLVAYITHLSGELSRANEVARVADKLVEEQRSKYTNRAFVMASLSFLEKNKDLHPDTYTRAQKLCETFKCNDPSSSVDMVELSFTMAGIVRGLGTMAAGPRN